MAELKVRIACREDLRAIAEISRLTWEGDDYLESRATEWISDGSLRVGLLQGRVVGTFRISHMPAGVLWLEALRVHSDFQGMGFGKQIANAAFHQGRRIMADGDASCMEFSTYINNHESIHISMQQGFQVVNRFTLMSAETGDFSRPVEEWVPEPGEFRPLRGHIPCGWKFPRVCPGGIEWALDRSECFRFGEAVFIRKTDSDAAAPLGSSLEHPLDYLNGARSLAASRNEELAYIVFHSSRRDILDMARKLGFDTWEPVEAFNVLVFRYDQQ